jgi:hypothetical protein
MGVGTVHWLDALQEDVVRITAQAARSRRPGPTADDPPYFNCRLEHVRQAEREARHLLVHVAADRDVVIAGVWVHDRCQPQFEGGEGHGLRAADWARRNLASLGFPPGKVDSVCPAVAHHSDPLGTVLPQPVEARLLWDADELAKRGVLHIPVILSSAPASLAAAIHPLDLTETAVASLAR